MGGRRSRQRGALAVLGLVMIGSSAVTVLAHEIGTTRVSVVLSEAGRYCWTADGLDVIFNAYDVGPYSSGPYDVEIAYDRLKPLLRPDGPIAR